MDRKVFIIYKYFDFIKHKPTIGGVQTYISDLIEILTGLQLKPVVCQSGDSELTANMPNFEVYQWKLKSTTELIQCVKKYANLEYDVILYGTDSIIVPNDGFKHSIAIQHGVSWDIPIQSNHSLFRYIGGTALQTYKTIKRISSVNSLVCVDYNFQNWYRTQVDHERTNLIVIPNYTRIAPIQNKSNGVINIIFARRFFPYRGTRVFTHAIQRIILEYSNVHVTIAGGGPDEEWMKNELHGYKNVVFKQYDSSDSLTIHADKHIAVVPTVGSEGTSLSLLEAMSSQCAVVASDVGGITNILIDGFNGLMVKAGDSEQLYQSVKYLIDNPEDCHRLAMNGYETAKQGFSFEKWKSEWERVINNLISFKN